MTWRWRGAFSDVDTSIIASVTWEVRTRNPVDVIDLLDDDDDDAKLKSKSKSSAWTPLKMLEKMMHEIQERNMYPGLTDLVEIHESLCAASPNPSSDMIHVTRAFLNAPDLPGDTVVVHPDVTVKMLLKLNPGATEWIDSVLVNAFVDLMQVWLQQRDTPEDKTTLCLPSDHMAALVHVQRSRLSTTAPGARRFLILPEEFDAALRGTTTAAREQYDEWMKRARAAQRVFIPVSLDNVHWVLMEARVPSRTIIIHDSLTCGSVDETSTSFYQTMARVYADALTEWWDASISASTFIKDAWTVQFPPPARLQTDGYSCGVHVMWTLESLLFPEFKDTDVSTLGDEAYMQRVRDTVQTQLLMCAGLWRPASGVIESA
jgi:hypothetical protein